MLMSLLILLISNGTLLESISIKFCIVNYVLNVNIIVTTKDGLVRKVVDLG